MRLFDREDRNLSDILRFFITEYRLPPTTYSQVGIIKSISNQKILIRIFMSLELVSMILWGETPS